MKWSFLPPFAGLKQTRSQAGLLALGLIRPTRHAFPFDTNSGLLVAFVADYSCEGSGGFAPRFPSTCGVPGCQCGLMKLESASMVIAITGITQNRARMIHNPPDSVKTRIVYSAALFYLRPFELDKLFAIEIKSAPHARASPLVLAE